MRGTWTVALASVALAATAGGAQAATINVTTTADSVADDGRCSLREAFFAARFDRAVLGCPSGTSGEDVIQLEAADYRLAAGGSQEDGNDTGDLDTGPASVVRVVGRGVGATVVGGVGDRTFDVFSGATLGLADLTVRDSIAPPGGSGGAVRNRGVLTVVRAAFVNTRAGDAVPPDEILGPPNPPGSGGAIWSVGQLQVSDTRFAANRAGDAVTAFQAGRSAELTGGAGGAVHVAGGTASFANVTVTDGRAGDGGDYRGGAPLVGGGGGPGGAIAVTDGAATVVNGTFQGNRAGDRGEPRRPFIGSFEAQPGQGGALAAVAPGTLAVTFSTFSGNAAGSAPDGQTGVGASVAGVSVGASILADAGGACANPGPASLLVVVLAGDTSCAGPTRAGDPRLGPLTDNGGPVPTMALSAGSPAIDALTGVPCHPTDARGLPRTGACDVGAFEVQPAALGAQGAPGPGAGSGPGPGAGTAVPRQPATTGRTISRLTLAPGRFRAVGRRPLGTTVSFAVDAAGPVVGTVQRAAPGRRVGGRCVAPSRRNRSAPRCTRQLTLPGRIALTASAGTNTFRFSGRIGGRTLTPGVYTLVMTLAQAAPSAATVARRTFQVASAGR